MFEDQFGRTIEAELVSHTGADGETVTIERDGKEFEVKVSIFSEGDQKFIREWMKSTNPTIDYAFRVEAAKKKISSSTRGGTYRRSKVQHYTYEIKVTSLTRQPVKDIRIEYHAFMKDRSRTVRKGDALDVEGPLRYNQTVTFETEPFKLDTVRYSSYYSSSYSMKDSLLGVLVRVYGPDGKVVEDFRTSGTKFKERWPEKKPSQRRFKIE